MLFSDTQYISHIYWRIVKTELPVQPKVDKQVAELKSIFLQFGPQTPHTHPTIKPS